MKIRIQNDTGIGHDTLITDQETGKELRHISEVNIIAKAGSHEQSPVVATLTHSISDFDCLANVINDEMTKEIFRNCLSILCNDKDKCDKILEIINDPSLSSILNNEI